MKKRVNKKKVIKEWYSQYFNLLAKTAYDVIKDYDLAADIVQETFISVIEYFDTIYSLTETKRRGYMLCIAKNKAIHWLKKEQRHNDTKEKIEKEFFDISLFYTDDTLKDIMQKEYLRVYEQAMYKISELDRNLIKYKYELEFSNKEIADVCDLKVSYVSTYINRAMDKLRRAMKEVENE